MDMFNAPPHQRLLTTEVAFGCFNLAIQKPNGIRCRIFCHDTQSLICYWDVLWL